MIQTLKNRMYLNELFFLINRKDKRSLRSWCLKNQLQIYKDSSGEFVIREEFELAYNMPLIMNLKIKYGDRWIDFYEAHSNGNLYKILELKTNPLLKKTGYIPKGNLAKKLLGVSSK